MQNQISPKNTLELHCCVSTLHRVWFMCMAKQCFMKEWTCHICHMLFHCLTHWWTTFSNAFSWMKMYEFRLRFYWSLFPGVQLTIFQYWFKYWLGDEQATSHYLNQWLLDNWRIYASLGLNELIPYAATSRKLAVISSYPVCHAFLVK